MGILKMQVSSGLGLVAVWGWYSRSIAEVRPLGMSWGGCLKMLNAEGLNGIT